jgi:hypothetical protein
MAIAPQLLFWYDQLPLWIIARNARQGLLLSAISWIGYLAWQHATPGMPMGAAVRHAAPAVVWSTFLPALGIVVWHAWQDRRSQLARSV